LPRDVIVAIRPEDLNVSQDRSGLGNEFAARLVSQLFLGDITVYHLSANGEKMRGKTTAVDRRLEVGGGVYVRFPPEKLKLFPR
jgi:ABC-type Fe3+/spermidine/putrescine transport system ATPase subunit